MQTSLLQFPKKSHRKIITIPPLSIQLAELVGITLGDGGISNDWQLVISLNSTKDIEYSSYVRILLENLFDIDVVIRKRPKNTLVLVCSSTTLVDFLVKIKGGVKGNKIKQQITIPPWVKKRPEYKRAFVRGLIDTDGCLYIHKHKVADKPYVNIGLCFTSYSPPLISSVAQIFRENNITPHIHKLGRRIYLYSAKEVIKYLDIFGSSNPRITNIKSGWDAGVV